MQHYDLDLTYTPPAAAPAPLEGQLTGTATIDLVATQDLDRFNLDLRGMQVTALTINGKRADAVAPPAAGAEVEGAAYWQVQDDTARVWELTVQPRPKLKAGQHAQVVIEYGGTTTRPTAWWISPGFPTRRRWRCERRTRRPSSPAGSPQWARFAQEHDRDLVADREGELAGRAVDLAGLLVELEGPLLALRASEDLFQVRRERHGGSVAQAPFRRNLSPV